MTVEKKENKNRTTNSLGSKWVFIWLLVCLFFWPCCRACKMWSTGEGDGKPLQYSCLESPMNSMRRQKDRTLKDELPKSLGAQYATGAHWRNNSRKNEEMEPKQKQHPGVDVTCDGSKDAVNSNIA